MSVPSFIANYNGNGHTPSDAGDNGFGQHSDISFDDTEPAPHTFDPDAWEKKREEAKCNAWMQHEPPFLHSLKYHIDGIEHMTVIRVTDVDSLWLEVRMVMVLVKATKAKAQAEEHKQAVAALFDNRMVWGEAWRPSPCSGVHMGV